MDLIQLKFQEQQKNLKYCGGFVCKCCVSCTFLHLIRAICRHGLGLDDAVDLNVRRLDQLDSVRKVIRFQNDTILWKESQTCEKNVQRKAKTNF